MSTYNEHDIVVQYADHKGGGDSGQLVIDEVELTESSDNRVRHGIGNPDPSSIEKGNSTYTFSTTTMLNDAAVQALKNIKRGDAVAQAIYVMHTDDDGNINYKEKASGMVPNDITETVSDGGDTNVSIDADLMGLDLSGTAAQ
jgi:hypothetical protein